MWRKKPTAESQPLPSSRSTLAEVLRLNDARKNSSLAQGKVQFEDRAFALNKDLVVLADFFPDVAVEALRDVLRRYDGDSRLEVSTNQLNDHKELWARGRLLQIPRDPGEEIPQAELFRTAEYRNAVANLLQKEFITSSRSGIDGVLAEVNSSYTRARPIMQEIVTKSWRNMLVSLFRKRKELESPPALLWQNGRFGTTFQLSGSTELDRELFTLFLERQYQERAQTLIIQDHDLALKLNEEEAEQQGALYECQICYSDVPFESVTACSTNCHYICYCCIRRSLSEAIYGQNWAQSINTERASLKCLAPSDPSCEGFIPASQAQQAVSTTSSSKDLWTKFENRLAEKAVQTSQLPLVRCLFCPYVEAQQTLSSTSPSNISWHFSLRSTSHTLPSFLYQLFLTIFLFTLYILLFAITYPFDTTFLSSLLHTSLSRLSLATISPLFQCRNPTCKKRSCLNCTRQWHDPHICTSSLTSTSTSSISPEAIESTLHTSLRTHIENARSNAIKRVCPRCQTSFVKSSGCNKLVCPCGYSMCYMCRANIGTAKPSLQPQAALPIQHARAANRIRNVPQAEIEVEGEGYRHFCTHFRPVPGKKCSQCERCELYADEDEDEAVRMAGVRAEREWRDARRREEADHKARMAMAAEQVKEGIGMDRSTNTSMSAREGEQNDGIGDWKRIRVDHDTGRRSDTWIDQVFGREWTLQGVMDGLVRRIIVVKH